MNDTHKGLLIFLAALGMLLGLMAGEVSSLTAWADATSPAFVAKIMLHLSAVIAAFVGGRYLPTPGQKE